jgi:hypothetical protein
MGASHRASPYNWVTIKKTICRDDTVHSVVPPLGPSPPWLWPRKYETSFFQAEGHRQIIKAIPTVM